MRRSGLQGRSGPPRSGPSGTGVPLEDDLVNLAFASWNRIAQWLRHLDRMRALPLVDSLIAVHILSVHVRYQHPRT
jgi:hypothetical protein